MERSLGAESPELVAISKEVVTLKNRVRVLEERGRSTTVGAFEEDLEVWKRDLHEAMEKAEKQHHDLKVQLEKERATTVEVERYYTVLDRRLQDFEQHASNTQSSIENMEISLKDMRNEVKTLKDRCDNMEKRITALEKAGENQSIIADLRLTLEDTKKVSQDMHRRCENLETEIGRLQSSRESDSKEIRKLRDELDEANEGIQNANDRYKNLQDQLKDVEMKARQSEEAQNKKILDMQQKLEEAKADANTKLLSELELGASSGSTASFQTTIDDKEVVEVVMSIGSRVPENENAVQVYRTDHKKWLPGKSTCFGRKLAAAASFANGTVMVTGGSRGRKSTEVYKPESNSWSLSDEMQHGRESHALVNFGDKLYSIGGVGKAGKQLNSVELLEDVGRGWTLSKPLKFARDELAAAATSSGIVVAGGYDGKSILDSCEFFKPNTGWTPISSLQRKRAGAVAASHGDKVFVFGGRSDAGVLDSVEQWDATSMQWNDVQLVQLQPARHDFAAVSIDNLIYLIGGYNKSIGDGNLHDFSCFSPADERLESLGPLPRGCSSLSAAATKIPIAILQEFEPTVAPASLRN